MVLEVNIDTECRIVMNSVNILFDSGVHQWEFFCMIFPLLIWFSKKQSEDKLLFSGSNELMVRGSSPAISEARGQRGICTVVAISLSSEPRVFVLYTLNHIPTGMNKTERHCFKT